MNIFKKILSVLKVLVISYILFIINACIVGLVYIKIVPVATKASFPFGSLGLLLTVLEWFIYYRFIKRPGFKK